ncbi:MAG: hypothetical protein LBO21_03205 [Synergistaceae bacterium]|jgi:hypothetical protein|nr:hypothetical protein [Synergistaceae bacterium]
MATYLIDYENPAGKAFICFADSYSLIACNHLTDFTKERYGKEPCLNFWTSVKKYDYRQPCSCNKVVLFYSVNSPQANIEEVKAKCTETYEYVPNGIKHGLDFQLTVYLGGLIYRDDGMPSDSIFYIVSRDKGFVSALHFLEENSNFCGLSFDLLSSEDDFLKALVIDEINQLNIYGLLYEPNVKEDLQSVVKHQAEASEMTSTIMSAFFEQTNRQNLHNKIQRIVGSGAKCKQIYQLFRPLFDIYRKHRKKIHTISS